MVTHRPYAIPGTGKSVSPWIVGGIIALLVLTAAGFAVWQPWQPTFEPASVEQMAFALPDKPSLAVLPFSNIGDDAVAGAEVEANETKHSGVVNSLVGDGANIEITPALRLDMQLSRAVSTGRKALVELLISKGANVNSSNSYFNGPLHRAAISGNLEVIQILLANDADINAKAIVGAYLGETALHAAAFAGHLQVAELLLANGANVNAADLHSYTPIRRAVEQGDVAMANLLIDKGADITIRDQGGMTLLHVVAPARHVAIAERLIAEGVDINALANSGFKPLDYALGGAVGMVETLERHGGACTTC